MSTSKEPIRNYQRLPVWAQQEMAKLRQDAELTRERAEIAEGNGPDESPVVVTNYRSDLDEMKLNVRDRVKFLMPNGYVEVCYRVDPRMGPYVEVATEGRMSIQPQASNVLRVIAVAR